MKMFSFIVCTIVLLFSCKKNKEPQVVLKTLLVKETRSNGVTYDYKYGIDNLYSGYVYNDASNNQQETFVTQYDANNKPAEIIFRDHTNGRAAKYNYTYDSQKRCIKIEQRDSTNPTTYTLARTYDFTYSSTSVIRRVTLASTGTGSRINYMIDATGNYSRYDVYNALGTLIQEVTFRNYDNKPNPYSAAFEYLFLDITPKNNHSQQDARTVSTGATVNSTATHIYNSDGYPTQTLWSNGFTYNYVYDKR
jgi:hypothetical protein